MKKNNVKNKNLLSISGKSGVGKDSVATIIDMLVAGFQPKTIEQFVTINKYNGYHYDVKKFADKLKDIVCILLGCTREQLEDREFKEKILGEEWWYWKPIEEDTGGLIPYREPTGTLPCNLIKLSPRLLLQLIGTECGRQIIHPNLWCNSLFLEYKDILITPTQSIYSDKANNPTGIVNIPPVYGKPNWCITDMRFPNELEAVKQRNGITIRVNRGTLSMVKMAEEHTSETALDHITDWDYVIDNTGTILELIEKVREILIKEQIIK